MNEFTLLAQEIESKQDEVNKLKEKLVELMTQLGVGKYVQCDTTGTVYKVVEPTGTFMYYKKIDYVRTALEGERAGSLSKKEAETAGFTLKK